MASVQVSVAVGASRISEGQEADKSRNGSQHFVVSLDRS